MSYFVVDTNVPIVANGNCEQVNEDCVLSCIDALNKIISGEVLLIDNLSLIFNEYKNGLNIFGQPGAGDAFFKWVFYNQANENSVIQIKITPNNYREDDFLEFPQTEDLCRFDHSDKKFVAVALASNLNPQILNASDSDWQEYIEPLMEAGLQIKFLC
jgi:hypothetical protein